VVVYRLCIVGLGLMGGAIGINARRKGSASRVIGVADNRETIEKALALGAVDDATLDLRGAVADADMVILCVPVRSIMAAAQAVLPACRDGAIVTDIGSSKAHIVRDIENLIHRSKSKVHFVGSHPVTGSEKKGIDASDSVQIEGAPCVVTPTQHTDIESYRKVDEFWKSLGFKTTRLSPEEHDAVLARSSHIPHLLSPALVTIQTERSLDISGPGLRDMARLTGSDPTMWTDIIDQNAVEIGRALKDLGQELLTLAQEIEQLARPGTPGAEAARERVFRFLADARQRYDKRYAPTLKKETAEDAEAAEPEA
jgi:prephenate dehydrogenase